MGNDGDIPSGYVNIAIEMAIYSGFIHQTWWFSIVMLVYQRVPWTMIYIMLVSLGFKMTTMDTVGTIYVSKIGIM